jgi:DNA-binding MarR family transcriptional regulator
MSLSRHQIADLFLRMAHVGIQITTDLTTVFPEPGLVRNSTVATLLRLYDEGALRPVELMDSTGVTRGGMTKIIDHLEEAGLVERWDDPSDDDGRSVRARLTPAGHKRVKDMLDVIEPAMEKFLVDLEQIAAEG